MSSLTIFKYYFSGAYLGRMLTTFTYITLLTCLSLSPKLYPTSNFRDYFLHPPRTPLLYPTMTSARPVLLILPGGSQNPTHYGYLAHLLQSAGYPTSSALFPSAGNTGKIGSQDDADFFRDRLILPYIDQGQDVILIMHSYSGLPGSAAALGLSKAERAAQGKKGGVIGQIFCAALLQRGGDGTDLLTALGGKLPPFLQANVRIVN